MSEGDSVIEPVEVATGIWQLPMPLAARTEPVNAYLLVDPDDGSVTVFDTGIARSSTQYWRSALGAIGRSSSDVERILVSHHHPDHIGGSGGLHSLTKATLIATRSTIDQAPDVWGDSGRIESYFNDVARHLHEHGLPSPATDHLASELEHARAAVVLAPEAAWQAIADGDHIDAAGRTWRCYETPGHADGHLVLHSPEDGLLLAGDHLLERISPAVGKFPRHERDPLARYLESLMRIAMLDLKLVLPGHGAPFPDGAQRARALMRHHEQRLDACVEVVKHVGSACGISTYDVARTVFAHVLGGEAVDPVDQRFATTETLAHLERARAIGRVARTREISVAGGATWRWTMVEG